MSETIKGQRTYYSPDDIVIYPPSELGFCGDGMEKAGKKLAEESGNRTPLAELSGEGIQFVKTRDDSRDRGRENSRHEHDVVAELDSDGGERS